MTRVSLKNFITRKVLTPQTGYFLWAVLVVLWLTVLKDTDSFYSCYIAIAFLSFYFMRSSTDAKPNFFRLSILFPALVFSVSVYCANYPLFTELPDPYLMGRITGLAMCVKNSVICLAGGIAVAMPICEKCLRYCQADLSSSRLRSSKHDRAAFSVIFCALLPIYLIMLYFVEYPGTLTPDPLAQIKEMISGEYSNFNSFYHTLLFQSFLYIGNSLFHDPNAAVATFCTFQVLIVCASFAWCIQSMRLAGVSAGYLLVTLLIYGLAPFHLGLSVTVWKDTLFGIGCLLLCTSLFRCIRSLGNNVINHIVFSLGCLVFCLARNIGVVACLVTFLCLLLFLRDHRSLLWCMGTVTLLCLLLNGPVITILGISGTDDIEFLSLPLQQVSRVIADGCSLTPEETALLSRVLDLEQVPQVYQRDFADPMKKMLRSIDVSWFWEHLAEYARLYIRLGFRYPFKYIGAWIDQTKGYWNSGYTSYLYSRVITANPYGLYKTRTGSPVYNLFQIWLGSFEKLIIFQPLYSIGLHSWTLGLIMYVQALKKRKEWILGVPPAVILLGLILGAPVANEFRYAYPILTSFPLILSAFLFPPAESSPPAAHS